MGRAAQIAQPDDRFTIGDVVKVEIRAGSWFDTVGNESPRILDAIR